MPETSEHVTAHEAWDQGRRFGTSRAMRHMSDEPGLPLASADDNPYSADRPVAGPMIPAAEVEALADLFAGRVRMMSAPRFKSTADGRERSTWEVAERDARALVARHAAGPGSDQ